MKELSNGWMQRKKKTSTLRQTMLVPPATDPEGKLMPAGQVPTKVLSGQTVGEPRRNRSQTQGKSST